MIYFAKNAMKYMLEIVNEYFEFESEILASPKEPYFSEGQHQINQMIQL